MVRVSAYFDKEKNVKAYMEMVIGMDGRKLIDILKGYLKKGSSLLELGMGPGADLDILGQFYEATGSDTSSIFLDLYRKRNPKADLMLLDAQTLETEKRFDCIYSNKVLMHLEKDGLVRSFERQMDILNHGGIAFHSFWRGQGQELMEDLMFVYYEIEDIEAMLPKGLSVIESGIYDEDKKNDSFYVILKKTEKTS